MFAIGIFIFICYFIPSILAFNKRGFGFVFLMNFFLGWTVIGWFIALLLALQE